MGIKIKFKIVYVALALLFLQGEAIANLNNQVQERVLDEILFIRNQELKDNFGYSVDIDEDVAIVGAWGKDDRGDQSGTAYIYEFVNGQWSQPFELVGNRFNPGDRFGSQVRIKGNTAVVSSPGYQNRGAVYVFQKSGDVWEEIAFLEDEDGQNYDDFGKSIAIDRDLIVIGSSGTDDLGTSSGSVYVYRNIEGEWIREARLLASDGAAKDMLGSSIDVEKNRIVVGAKGKDGYAGAVYVFDYLDNEWTETSKLILGDHIRSSDQFFGASLSMSENKLLVGASGFGENNSRSGAAFIFEYSNREWSEPTILTAHDWGKYDYFGVSVSLKYGRALIGSYRHETSWFRKDEGAAYFFEQNDEGEWVECIKYTPENGLANEYFGLSVSLGSDKLMVGSPGKNNSTGSVYALKYREKEWVQTRILNIEHEDHPGADFYFSFLGDQYRVNPDPNILEIDGVEERVSYIYDDIFGELVQSERIIYGQEIGEYSEGDRRIRGVPEEDDRGAAYIDEYNGEEWVQMARLFPDGLGLGYGFGEGTYLIDDRAFITTYHSRLYIFDYVDGEWVESDQIVLSQFIWSLSIENSGQRIVSSGRDNDGWLYFNVYEYVNGGWAGTFRFGDRDISYSTYVNEKFIMIRRDSTMVEVYESLGDRWDLSHSFDIAIEGLDPFVERLSISMSSYGDDTFFVRKPGFPLRMFALVNDEWTETRFTPHDPSHEEGLGLGRVSFDFDRVNKRLLLNHSFLNDDNQAVYGNYLFEYR